jgi:hypothetical protein
MMQVGDTLMFSGGSNYTAKLGAKAIFIKSIGDFIEVEWIRDELSGKQMDGCYSSSMFKKVEEVSTQKEDRILIENEKDMKFEFEKGKILLIEYFQSELERGEIYTLEAIKGLDSLEDIESEIDSFRYFKRGIEDEISCINQSKTLSDIFRVLSDTDLEDDDETVLSFFIEGLK